VQESLRREQVLHGNVPEQRIFLDLHGSQARLTLESFRRLSAGDP
jgi:hypothetical protein